MFVFPNTALDYVTKTREMLLRKQILTYQKLISIC